MSSGKVHAAIGVTTTLIGTTAYCVATKDFNVPLIMQAGVGAYVGSLIVDVDSKKSKGSQIFNKILIGFLIAFVAIPIVSSVFDKLVNNQDGLDPSTIIAKISQGVGKLTPILNEYIVKNTWGLYLFILITILGKLSPHRQFTHKIVGTLGFLLIGVITFKPYIFIGFAVGFLLHLVADATTPAGLDFFDVKMPLQKSDGSYVKILK